MSLQVGHSLWEESGLPDLSPVGAPGVVVQVQMLLVGVAVSVEAVVAVAVVAVAVAGAVVVAVVPASVFAVVVDVDSAVSVVAEAAAMPYFGDPCPAGTPVEPAGLGPPAG